MKRAALFVALMVLGTACVPPSPTRYQPTNDRDPYAELVLTRPGDGVINAADPEVIRVEDTWYLYATTSDAGFEAWSSHNLFDWTYEGLVWTPTPGSWNDIGKYWAPELFVSANGVFLYYTAGHRIGVARSDSPLGPFTEVYDHPFVGDGHGGIGDGHYWGSPEHPVFAIDSQEQAIDAFLFEASDGSLTMYFSNYPALGIAVMSAVSMVDETTVAPGPATVVLDARVTSWELFIREAPIVHEHDGVFHLTYSGSGADGTCYAIGEATATDPLGPFTRVGNGPMLHDDPAIGFFGPGHHTLVEGPDDELVMIFHTKNEYDLGYERRLRWAPVSIGTDGNLTLDAAPPGNTATGRSTCNIW